MILNSSELGGFDVPFGCNIDFSVEQNARALPLAEWMAENTRTDGVDEAVSVGALVGIRKSFVADVSGEQAAMALVSKAARVYLFSTVGSSCTAVMDKILQTASIH